MKKTILDGLRKALRRPAPAGEGAKVRPLPAVCAALAAALLMAGCGGRAYVKTGMEQAVVAPTVTPLPAGLQAPALVDFHVPVSDQDYQAALPATAAAAEVDRRNEADFQAVAQYEYNHAVLDDALKTYQRILMAPGVLPRSDRAQYMVGEIYYEKKDYLPALAAFQNVLEKYGASPYAAQSRQMMGFILANSMSLDDLSRYVANYPDSPMRCAALFQLGSHEVQAGMQAGAMDHLGQFLQQCPQDPSAAAAQTLLQSLQAQAQGKTWKIGVLIPRTGPYAGFGKSVLNGVMLAMEQANQSGGSRKPMSVVVRDTAGDPGQAVRQFKDLDKDGSLDAVIGPVITSEIAAVAPLAVGDKIALITPSIGPSDMYALGPYLFSNSMTNDMQGSGMARYAVQNLGLRQFAVLAPDDAYGSTLSDAFEKTVDAMGGTVTAYETYTPGSTDFKKQLLALGGQDPGAIRDIDRKNTRSLAELQYDLKQEVGKILLKERNYLATLPPPSSPVTPVPTPAAVIPVVEALTNTACPSAAADVNAALKGAFQDHPEYVLRDDDLVKQSLTLLPPDAQGNTKEVTADQWAPVAQDLQASLLIAGQVVETDPAADWGGEDPNWNYVVNLQAFRMDPKKGTLVQFYRSRVPYSLSKPASMLKANINFQGLYLPAHAAEIPLLASQAHFYDLNPVLLGGHYWLNDTVLQEGGKDLEGAYFTTGFFVDGTQDLVKKFAADYLQRFGERPDLLAAQSFDAARLLLAAANASSVRDDIHNNLMAVQGFDGVSGKTTFNGKGQATKVVPILKIQNGQYQQMQ